ncbi:MAG: MBL fold metallo-hydrolase [Spirochaetales bacterium]|jgi:phosphoribosyl 1,2-cyclic phosphodiesterase|nr:MBL fold metallo-hydrolase [Spirochaetales bacterium]
MFIKFWGVRGSVPTPLTPRQLEGKVAAVIQRIKPDDILSEEARGLFMAELPASLLNSIGGNSTCVEIRLSDGTRIVLDGGTGLREMGIDMMKKKEIGLHLHIFFTHFHWDHIQGLPFFDPAYLPENSITYYSPMAKMETYLRDQMKAPYFPVTMDDMNAKKTFTTLHGSTLDLGRGKISWRAMKHPGGCFAYKIEDRGKSLVFSSDTELRDKDFEKNPENRRFFEGVDYLIMDSQYTLDEAIEKYEWGHSSYSLAVDFAAAWGVKNLGLFHHEPKYGDNKIYSILNSANWYANHLESRPLKIFLVTEGLELEL